MDIAQSAEKVVVEVTPSSLLFFYSRLHDLVDRLTIAGTSPSLRVFRYRVRSAYVTSRGDFFLRGERSRRHLLF